MAKIYLGGTFDITHFGHFQLFRSAKKFGKVTVSVNTDEFVEQYKGHKPILTLDERVRSIRSCKYVSKVIPNTGGKDSKPSILEVQPDIIAIGDDFGRVYILEAGGQNDGSDLIF